MELFTLGIWNLGLSDALFTKLLCWIKWVLINRSTLLSIVLPNAAICFNFVQSQAKIRIYWSICCKRELWCSTQNRFILNHFVARIENQSRIRHICHTAFFYNVNASISNLSSYHSVRQKIMVTHFHLLPHWRRLLFQSAILWHCTDLDRKFRYSLFNGHFEIG